jgi:hypothetical protein
MVLCRVGRPRCIGFAKVIILFRAMQHAHQTSECNVAFQVSEHMMSNALRSPVIEFWIEANLLVQKHFDTNNAVLLNNIQCPVRFCQDRCLPIPQLLMLNQPGCRT